MALAEQLLVAANADIGAAKALFFPTLSLTGFLGGVNGDLTSLLGGGGTVFSLTPSLLQPIFNAGRLKQNVRVMQARFDAAIAEYRKSALNGYREVANALVTIQKLAEVREQQRIGVEALTDAADLARARYDSGLASYLEILTADQELFTGSSCWRRPWAPSSAPARSSIALWAAAGKRRSLDENVTGVRHFPGAGPGIPWRISVGTTDRRFARTT